LFTPKRIKCNNRKYIGYVGGTRTVCKTVASLKFSIIFVTGFLLLKCADLAECPVVSLRCKRLRDKCVLSSSSDCTNLQQKVH